MEERATHHHMEKSRMSTEQWVKVAGAVASIGGLVGCIHVIWTTRHPNHDRRSEVLEELDKAWLIKEVVSSIAAILVGLYLLLCTG
jgi:predicted Co/Zn/Cd cation transporter (cation efflux family)